MPPFTFFISYRREHTAPVALLLKYEIEKRLQLVRVFVDVEEIHQGMNFQTRIKSGNTTEQGSQNWDRDWVVTELMHSAASPIAYEAGNLYERKRVPFFRSSLIVNEGVEAARAVTVKANGLM